MPQNGKHLRESLTKAHTLMKKMDQSAAIAERDPMVMNRLLAMRRKKDIYNISEGWYLQKRQYAQYGVIAMLCLGFLVILSLSKDYLPYDRDLGELVTVTSGQSTVYGLNDKPNVRIEVHMTLPSLDTIQTNGNSTDALSAIALSLEMRQDGVWVPIGTTHACTFKYDVHDCFYAYRARHLMDGRSGDLQLVYRIQNDAGVLEELTGASGGGSSLEATATVAFNSHVKQYDMLGQAKIWIALVVLLGTLFFIAFELLHRTLVAFSGAFLMLLLLLALDEAPDMEMVIQWMDEGALGLLFGMMIIVGKLSRTGIFEVLTVNVIGYSKGNKWYMAMILCVLTAFLSAFLDNVTTVLLIAPVTMSLAKVLNIDPIPFLISETIFSNIGGAATMIGDPPNIIVGNALSDEVQFMDFIYVLTPIIIIMSGPCMLLLRFLNRDTLVGQVDKENYKKALRLKHRYQITNKHLLIQSLIVLATVILGFLLHPVHHVDPAWIALFGATLLLVFSSPHEIHQDLEMVEWETLLFFAALFAMIEAMAEVGLIREIGDQLISLIESVPTASRTGVSIFLITSVSGIVSAFLDNIPYTATMIPVIRQLSDAGLGLSLKPLVWSLCLGACLGGNGSLIGASANIVVAGVAHREGVHITFKDFFRSGFPIMCLSLVFAVAYLEILYQA